MPKKCQPEARARRDKITFTYFVKGGGMAKLPAEIKAFIVQALACFEPPSRVVEMVKVEFGITITRQRVSAYEPSNAMARSLSSKWVVLFNTTRDKFQEETADIAISHKAYRLRVLDRMASSAERMNNYGMTAQLLEQAAKEVGGAYTNRVKVEKTRKEGGIIKEEAISLSPQQASEKYKDFLG